MIVLRQLANHEGFRRQLRVDRGVVIALTEEAVKRRM